MPVGLSAFIPKVSTQHTRHNIKASIFLSSVFHVIHDTFVIHVTNYSIQMYFGSYFTFSSERVELSLVGNNSNNNNQAASSVDD